MTSKCCGFNTISAYINNNLINANDYIINKNNKILCDKNHELIFVNANKRIKYFRHKNTEDMTGLHEGMIEWHKNWQIQFDHVEIPFTNTNQIKDRRCDILIDDYVIEIQHSQQTKEETNDRYHDYTIINNKQIIWIIDGGNSIVEQKENRIIIEIDKQWKIDNYKQWNFIFLDINKIIYKIYPNFIKNSMIDCNELYSKDDFINILKNNIKSLYNINIPVQCNLYLKQQGAGNGKTYGIIQQINDDNFEYDNYVLITKMHSAKFNIYDEFQKQQELNNIKNLKGYDSYQYGNQYIIEFERNNIKKYIAIGTVDSFFHSISNKYIKKDKYANIFKIMVENVCNNLIEINNINNFKYAGNNIKLHKKMCLIIDETQDLDEIYGGAIINMMQSRYIDCYIVGDLLQSISNKNNAFKFLLNYKNELINIHKFEYTNNVRRFNDKRLIEFVNYMVDFEKYNLPKIKNDYMTETNDALNLVMVEPKDKNDDITKLYINKIMSIYEKEINNGYKKEDILIITPIISDNNILIALETKINQYWNNILDNIEYKQHAVFHKSEEGKSINLDESKYSTRLISIHTSKGLGHKVVIVFNLTERALNRFSKSKKNLIYESLIHVALTRMKEKIYVVFEDNNDSISNKLINFKNEYPEIKYFPRLNVQYKINYKKYVIECYQNNDFEFDDDIKEPLLEMIEKLDNKIIDMGHHNIRYYSMKSYIFIKALLHMDRYNKQQYFAILNEIYKSDTEIVNTWPKYNETKNIPIFKFTSKNTKSENYIYFDIFKQLIESVKNKCNDLIDKKIKILCPIEMIIFYYLLKIYHKDKRKYNTISPTEIYNIINAYYKSFNSNLEGHNYCLCKKLFRLNNKENEIPKYISNHYETLQILDKHFDDFIADKKELIWLCDHKIALGSNNNDYEISQNFDFICYNNENVYFITIKPQLNNLNFINEMISIYFNKYLFQNINKYSEKEILDYKNNDHDKNNDRDKNIKNYIKFGNKSIHPIIISLNNDKYISFEFINKNIEITDKIIDSLYNYLISDSKLIYYTFKYYYDKSEKNSSKSKMNDIINSIKNDIDTKYPKYPKHLLEFLNKIKNKLEDIKISSDRKLYLNSYLDITFFIDEFNKHIKKSIENHLIEIDDSSEDED